MKQFLSVLFVSAVAFSQTKSTTPAKKSTVVAKKAAPARPRNLLIPSTLRATAPATYRAKFTTTQGDFTVLVTRALAPIGADRFYNLVRGKFFDGAAFFRVIPGFMVQFGISPDPKVSSAWNNENLMDEPVKSSNKRGFLTFAKSGQPNSRTTQLFINYGDNSRLDADGFAPFGEVIQGMDVVDKFYSGYGGNPDQGALQQLGKPWVEKNMPKVDTIKTAVIVPLVAPAPVPTKAPAAKSTAAPVKKSTVAPATKSTRAATKSTLAAKSTSVTKAAVKPTSSTSKQ